MPFTISIKNMQKCGKPQVTFQASGAQLNLPIRQLCHLHVISIKTTQECGKPKNTFQGSIYSVHNDIQLLIR